MPTYQYACTEPECGHQFEAVQSFSDPTLSDCPSCEGRLRKVFSAVGVVDRDYSFGSPFMSGVLANEVRSALYSSPGEKPPVVGFIAGLGGREVTVPDVERITDGVYNAAEGRPQPLTQWIGLRE